MKYTVVWRETVLQQLASVWMASTNRNVVNRAVDWTDAELSNDPDQKGDDYFGDRYVITPVMWVLYRVQLNDLIAEVLQVGRPGLDLPHDDLPVEE